MANSMRKSGGGFRNPLITSADIPDGSITTTKLAALAVTSAKIADLAVTDAKIGSLSASKITAGTISAQTITMSTGGLIQLSSGEIRSGTGSTYVKLSGNQFDRVEFVRSNVRQGYIGSVGSNSVTLFGDNDLSIHALGTLNLIGTTKILTSNDFDGLNIATLLNWKRLDLTPVAPSSGQVVLALDIERSWEFRQSGTGASTALRMASTSNKALEIWSDSSAAGLDIVPSSERIRRSGYSGPYLDLVAGGPELAVNSSNRVNLDGGLTQFRVRLGGSDQMVLGTAGFIVPNVYSATTSSAGAGYVKVLTSGQLVRYTSSRRYKKSIRPWHGRESVLDLEPVTFRSRHSLDDGRRVELGLIAEEVAQKFPKAAIYDPEGRPESIAWEALTTGILAALIDVDRRLQVIEGLSS